MVIKDSETGELKLLEPIFQALKVEIEDEEKIEKSKSEDEVKAHKKRLKEIEAERVYKKTTAEINRSE